MKRIVGWFSVVVLLFFTGCFSNTEVEAEKLFVSASSSVNLMKDQLENQQFSQAYSSFLQAQKSIRALFVEHRSSVFSQDLLNGNRLLGEYPLVSFRKLGPVLSVISQAEKDPLAAFLFLNGSDSNRADLALIYAESGNVERAMDVVATISSDNKKQATLERITKSLASTGKAEVAERIAQFITLRPLQLSSHVAIARSYAESRDIEKASLRADQTLRLAENFGERNRWPVIPALAGVYAKIGQPAIARKLLDEALHAVDTDKKVVLVEQPNMLVSILSEIPFDIEPAKKTSLDEKQVQSMKNRGINPFLWAARLHYAYDIDDLNIATFTKLLSLREISRGYAESGFTENSFSLYSKIVREAFSFENISVRSIVVANLLATGNDTEVSALLNYSKSSLGLSLDPPALWTTENFALLKLLEHFNKSGKGDKVSSSFAEIPKEKRIFYLTVSLLFEWNTTEFFNFFRNDEEFRPFYEVSTKINLFKQKGNLDALSEALSLVNQKKLSNLFLGEILSEFAKSGNNLRPADLGVLFELFQAKGV